MRRRDISKVLLATAAGQPAVGRPARVETSAPPYHAQTAAESAAGVTPTSYSYPSHSVCGYVLLERYGGAGDNSTINDAAFAKAVLVAGQVDAPIGITMGTAGVWKFTSAWQLSGTGQTFGGIGSPVRRAGATGARVVGLGGRPVISFSGLGSTTDCVVLGGSNLPQVELRNLQIQCNGSVAKPNGRDGVVILGSNKPIIDNVVIWNSQRDAFVLAPNGSSGQWIEKGQFDIQVRFAGRHGVMMSLLGTLNPFINECEWRYELRGCSYVTAGGNAIRMSAATGLGGAAKFADHRFLATAWDCIYQKSGRTAASQLPQLPHVSPVTIDSGTAQAFVFINPAWENTANGALPGAGYSCQVSGRGVWSGLAMILTNINSYWGTGIDGINPDPAIKSLTCLDYSFNRTALMGPVTIGTSHANTADLSITRTGPASQSIGQNANISCQNQSSRSGFVVQEYYGDVIIFSQAGGGWAEVCRVTSGGPGQAGVRIAGLSTVYSCNGGPPSVELGADGDYAFRQDTPETANQRLYVKTGGRWTGIL